MLICVTDRKLCGEDFLERIKKLVKARPYAMLLREKDLDARSYEQLARQVKPICEAYGVQLILRNAKAAQNMRHTGLHLSMPEMRRYDRVNAALTVGVSVHSAEEAAEAQALGADYLILGHIFATDCKKGVPPRGLSFLREVCKKVSIPVFAIGGISPDNVGEVMLGGAKGFCIMSTAMTCAQPEECLNQYYSASSAGSLAPH